MVYYLPIVNAIRAPDLEPQSLEWADGSYIRRYFADVDLHLSVRADIAALTPPDDGSQPETGERAALSLYELVLRLDEGVEDAYQPTPAVPQDDCNFLGSDGVVVELGRSWPE